VMLQNLLISRGSGGSEGGLSGPWPRTSWLAPCLHPGFVLSHSSLFDFHIQQITFNQQNF